MKLFTLDRLHFTLCRLRTMILVDALAVAPVLPTAVGQSVTGQVSGTVTDPAGAVIGGATVELIHTLTGQVREFKTADNGAFVFPNIVAGVYDLRITLPG